MNKIRKFFIQDTKEIKKWPIFCVQYFIIIQEIIDKLLTRQTTVILNNYNDIYKMTSRKTHILAEYIVAVISSQNLNYLFQETA